ncbi:MAG TPA: DUF72 domain-containing protein [Amycolatopsis sp.]|jgi:hypothetical protein
MAMRRASPQLGRMSRNVVRVSGREPRGRVYRNRPRGNTRRSETGRGWRVRAVGETPGGRSSRRYPLWRKDFRPVGPVQRRELECLSHRLNAVGSNGPFCPRQRPEQAWFDGTPSDFVFAAKGGRFVTQLKQ